MKKVILKLTFLMFVTTLLINCSEGDESEDSIKCIDVGLTCSRSPFSYKSCIDSSGNVWWELNGTKYYNIIEATEAFENYCN